MKATVLIDNISEGSLKGEWGLSVYIEYEDKRILLDTGAGGRFRKNAEALGIDLSRVDYGVLSHAHYDHADGMPDFFSVNSKAKFFLHQGCGENCYGRRWVFSKYIGIKRGITESYKDRIEYIKGDKKLFPGCMVIGHKTKNLAALGEKAGMYRKENKKWRPDDFSHEQSLVLDTKKGLVIFSSCSHGGADNIINEVMSAYPGRKIHALVGGLHLYKSDEAEVVALAERIKKTGIEKLYTGHCTGKKGLAILRRELGEEKVTELHCSLVIEA